MTFCPSLPSVAGMVEHAQSDRARIDQAFAIVMSRLSEDEKQQYEMEVLPYLVSGSYDQFFHTSAFNAQHLPKGTKPAQPTGDRRRRKAIASMQMCDFTRCAQCGAMLVDEHVEGEMLVCDCGTLVREEEDGYELAYHDRENYEYRTNSIYKRPNHLQEVLLQLQGLEKTVVPAEVMERVRGEVKKYRLDAATITMSQVRDILRRLKLPKMYEHAAQIVHALSGRPPIVIPEDVEARIKRMFNEVCRPFRHGDSDSI